MMAVPVHTTPAFQFKRPAKLFESPSGLAVFPNVSYDVAENGSFLMIKGGAPAAASPVHVVVNWRAGRTN